jgi:hypothetical protein
MKKLLVSVMFGFLIVGAVAAQARNSSVVGTTWVSENGSVSIRFVDAKELVMAVNGDEMKFDYVYTEVTGTITISASAGSYSQLMWYGQISGNTLTLIRGGDVFVFIKK